MKVTQLKGGSLSSTSLYEDGDRKFIRKSISTKDNREYGYVRWYTQLKKLQRLAETCLFPKLLDVNYSNNSAYFDIAYLEGYRDIKTILSEDKLTEVGLGYSNTDQGKEAKLTVKKSFSTGGLLKQGKPKLAQRGWK